MARTFTDTEATRTEVPLTLGLIGPSGSGKTFSALRLATGIQRVRGGDIFVVDTESRRALHYAPTKHPSPTPTFKFRHVPFSAPFSPDDYLAVITHCAKRGAGVVVIDSMSHEHEGPGGVLEMHEAEVRRMAGDDWKKAERVKMLAWSKPKAARRRLINSLIQLDVAVIACFRAKDKQEIKPGEKPIDLGLMPIAGEEFVYEMVTNFLLPHGADGFPSWDFTSEKARRIFKLPEPFRPLFRGNPQLTEDIGEAMARWAKGGEAPAAQTAAPETATAPETITNAQRADLAALVESCMDRDDFLAWIGEDYGFTGTKDITPAALAEITAKLEAMKAKAA